VSAARKLIVLDRDGVINQDSEAFVKSPAEWVPLPGSLEGIATLTRAGFTIVVATNQSGVGRGLFDLTTLADIHRKMRRCIEAAGGRLAGIYVCPHRPDAGCDCRKPRPGLLRQIEDCFGCTLAGQPVVGDSERDIEAARAVQARPILVRTGNGRQTEKALQYMDIIEVFDDLPAVARALTDQ
jgi:D-glycero-D-manno-heptose 1,7-bisphosphate phosphatase